MKRPWWSFGSPGAPWVLTLNGEKLRVVADIDLKNIETFKRVLAAHEQILTDIAASRPLPTPLSKDTE